MKTISNRSDIYWSKKTAEINRIIDDLFLANPYSDNFPLDIVIG